MKRLFTLLGVCLLFAQTYAQAPQKMSYQTVIRDAGNELLTNASVGMQISILQGTASGTAVYVETQTPTTNANGLASVEIGGGSLVSGDFSTIDWAGVPYFVKTEIDPNGGSTYTITGTSQLLSVPYALYSETASYSKTINLASLPFVIDIDGNIYTTVRIGNQVWMQQNLKTTRYQNGDVIPNITNYTAWSNLTTDAYAVYNNNVTNDAVYGKLYNWYAVADARNVCPTGWHVPTDAEWTVLTDYLGGSDIAGGKMKEAGLVHWISPNTGATNESGFSGLPGGLRTSIGDFLFIGESGYWWSSSQESTTNALYRYLSYDFSDVVRNNGGSKGDGFSVRCLRD